MQDLLEVEQLPCQPAQPCSRSPPPPAQETVALPGFGGEHRERLLLAGVAGFGVSLPTGYCCHLIFKMRDGFAH